MSRTRGIGIIPAEIAMSYGLSGANIRASGVDWDVRRDDPNSPLPYRELDWHVYAGIAKSEVYRPARAALHDHLVAGLIIVLGVALVTLSGVFTVARR